MQMRLRLAQEAARIMSDSGLNDYQAAKRKAAERLGAHDTRNLPSNIEIEQALIEQQRLFNADGHDLVLRNLRIQALDAMRFLERWRPRLVGPVLQGTADAHSAIQLHLFADTAEQVEMFLLEHQIPHESIERRYRTGPDDYQQYPGFRFMFRDTAIELIVFTDGQDRKPPLSPVSGRPMERGSPGQVEDLLHADQDLLGAGG